MTEVTKKTITRLQSSLVSMGYRRGEKSWGKPVGFMLILADIGEANVEFGSYTEGNKGTVCWSKTGFGFDDDTTNEDFIYSIALAEHSLHIKEASDCGECKRKVFNFSTPADLYDMEL